MQAVSTLFRLVLGFFLNVTKRHRLLKCLANFIQALVIQVMHTFGASDAEKSVMLNTLVAYTGIERVDGNQWCTAVDSAWNTQWVGTVQCRDFQVRGDTLEVLTPWRQMPNCPGTTRSIITFERDK